MIFIEKVFGHVTTFQDRKWKRWMRATYSPTHAHTSKMAHTHVSRLSRQTTHVDRRHDIYTATLHTMQGFSWGENRLEPFETHSSRYDTAFRSSFGCFIHFFFFTTSRWPNLLMSTTGKQGANKKTKLRRTRDGEEKNVANNIMKHQILFYVSILFL